jgi:hypothetical protein
LKQAPEWTKNGAMWNIPAGYTQAERFLVQAGQLKAGDLLPANQLFTNKFLQQIYAASPPSNYELASVCGK